MSDRSLTPGHPGKRRRSRGASHQRRFPRHRFGLCVKLEAPLPRSGGLRRPGRRQHRCWGCWSARSSTRFPRAGSARWRDVSASPPTNLKASVTGQSTPVQSSRRTDGSPVSTARGIDRRPTQGSRSQEDASGVSRSAAGSPGVLPWLRSTSGTRRRLRVHDRCALLSVQGRTHGVVRCVGAVVSDVPPTPALSRMPHFGGR
jgi:hypothetical protein